MLARSAPPSRCRPSTDLAVPGARQQSSACSIREDQMKQLFLLGISLLAVAACAPPSPPPAVAGQPITPVSYASGSSANTTRAFDGTFTGLSVGNVAGGSITPGASTASVDCPNYTVSSLPPVTISNGLAQLQAIGLTFQGYVTTPGGLYMRSGVGQTFEGQIDSRNVLSGQVSPIRLRPSSPCRRSCSTSWRSISTVSAALPPHCGAFRRSSAF